MTGYEYHKNWFDWAFEHQLEVKPIHTALYMLIVETANTNGWVKHFRLRTDFSMQTIGVRNYKTYINAFLDLDRFGFISIAERSKNQHSANIIALVNNTKATTKALSKALSKADDKASPEHTPKHCECIKLVNKQTGKPINSKTKKLIETNVSRLEENLEDWLNGKFPKPKKPKKAPHKDLEIWKKLKTIYFEWYLAEKKRKYSWSTTKDGTALYQIVTKLQNDLDWLQIEKSEASMVESWEAVLRQIPLMPKPKWLYENVGIANINSQWNSILTSTQQQANGSAISNEDILREAERIAAESH